MWFRLALKLGCTVRELQARMSSSEFGEWVAFYSIEPFGDHIEDLRTGTLAALIANVNRAKDTPPYKPTDFIDWGYKPEVKSGPPSAEAMAITVFGVNLAEAKAKGKRKLVIKRPTRGA